MISSGVFAPNASGFSSVYPSVQQLISAGPASGGSGDSGTLQLHPSGAATLVTSNPSGTKSVRISLPEKSLFAPAPSLLAQIFQSYSLPTLTSAWRGPVLWMTRSVAGSTISAGRSDALLLSDQRSPGASITSVLVTEAVGFLAARGLIVMGGRNPAVRAIAEDWGQR